MALRHHTGLYKVTRKTTKTTKKNVNYFRQLHNALSAQRKWTVAVMVVVAVVGLVLVDW